MLNVIEYDVVFQEVPHEVSLALTIAGCPVRCVGCHRADTWRKDLGVALTDDYLSSLLTQYQGLISCVLFMGGEWKPQDLLLALKTVRTAGLKTALYSGLDAVSDEIKAHLTYLKTGAWIAECGGLDNPNTNQVFIDCRSGEVLNHLFWREHV